MPDRPCYLLTVTGPDRPGCAGRLFESMRDHCSSIVDIAQITIRGHLVLCIEIEAFPGVSLSDLTEATSSAGLAREGLAVAIVAADSQEEVPTGKRLIVHLLAPTISATDLATIFLGIARCSGSVERIIHLATYPVNAYELLVIGSDHEELRRELSRQAAQLTMDIAVQRAGLHRRAKHLIVMDVDSTLLQGEVIDLLAEKAGRGEEVAAITEAAMRGELDFAAALSERVALLAGLPEAILTEVGREVALTPGARTLIRTLKRLGYVPALVSGGFVEVIAELSQELGIEHVVANRLEVKDGLLTGRVSGPVIDRAAKAEALKSFALEVGVPLNQVVAVGDGANDIDMLATAGLGIAFNAKPALADVADTALNIPYLDAVLFLLGISREEIEALDEEEASNLI
ncbi:MAG: phosphoserine phosphatase SerB [Actinobacteria bacterium]|nr:phosphoserine phosphatase SerB [Actinomycetota bacterium]